MHHIPLIEACVDHIDSAAAAVQGGAARLELCDNLVDGGTTPSHGMLSHLLDTTPIPVYPIIRLRGGSFVYSREERRVMASDVDHATRLGARGVVVGALTPSGGIDVEAVAEILEHRRDAEVTFHRAFDLAADPLAALETLIAIGCTRLPTSGQRATAFEGRALIAELVRSAGSRLTVMAGGGVRAEDAEQLVRETGVRELHLRGAVLQAEASYPPRTSIAFRQPLPTDELSRWVTDPKRIAGVRAAAERGAGGAAQPT